MLSHPGRVVVARVGSQKNTTASIRPLCDSRSDLEVTTKRSALETLDLQANLELEDRSGCARGYEPMMFQGVPVELGPKVLLAAVMRDKGDSLSPGYGFVHGEHLVVAPDKVCDPGFESIAHV